MMMTRYWSVVSPAHLCLCAVLHRLGPLTCFFLLSLSPAVRALRNFPADTWVCLETAQAQVLVVAVDNSGVPTQPFALSFADFARSPPGYNLIIQAIAFPMFNDNAPNAATAYRSYRVAQRLQNAHPLVNAGFYFDGASAPSIIYGNITQCEYPSVVPNTRIPMAACTAHYRLSTTLPAIEQAIRSGFTNPTLDVLCQLVNRELTSVVWLDPANGDPQGNPQTRVDIATNLFRKWCIACLNAPVVQSQKNSADVTIWEQRAGTASAGSQEFLVSRMEEPISEPLIKSSAIAQTSGEMVYTQSTIPPGCLHATFITAWAPCGVLTLGSVAAAQNLICSYLSQYYGLSYTMDQWQVYSDVDMGPANLTNIHWYINTPPAQQSNDFFPFQTVPAYQVAHGQVVYSGQPVAMLVGPDERATVLAAAYLSTSDAGWVGITQNYKPILSISDSKAAGTVVIDGRPIPTALTSQVPGTTAFASCRYISNVPGSTPGTVSTTIDFSPYQNNPDYVYVDNVGAPHSVPAQAHFCQFLLLDHTHTLHAARALMDSKLLIAHLLVLCDSVFVSLACPLCRHVSLPHSARDVRLCGPDTALPSCVSLLLTFSCRVLLILRETQTAVAYPPQLTPPTQPKDLAAAAVAKAVKSSSSSSQIDPMAMLKPNPRPTQQFKPKNMGWPHGVPSEVQQQQQQQEQQKKLDGAVAVGASGVAGADLSVQQLPYPVDPFGNNNQPINNDKKSSLPVNTYMLVQSSTQSVMDVKGEVEVMLNW